MWRELCLIVSKLEEDLKFLRYCKEYQVIPKFIRFKTFSRNFQFTRTYRNWQFKLLDLEINSQTRKYNDLKISLETIKDELRSTLSCLDFKYIMFLLDAGLERKLTNVKITHSRKLKALGVDLSKKIDVNKVIFNFSNRILSDEEKEVLGLGLDFALPSINVNFMKYFFVF